jgi:hypothetical protein
LLICIPGCIATQVSAEEAQSYAAENGLIYMETSAKTNVNVAEVRSALSWRLGGLHLAWCPCIVPSLHISLPLLCTKQRGRFRQEVNRKADCVLFHGDQNHFRSDLLLLRSVTNASHPQIFAADSGNLGPARDFARLATDHPGLCSLAFLDFRRHAPRQWVNIARV